jgi:multiple sugar transport system permease protein
MIAQVISPRTWKKVRPYVWVGPTLLILVSILIYPWAYCFWLSFHSWTPLDKANPIFIGIQNYISIFSDPVFYGVLSNTLIFVVSTITVSFVAGFAIALMISKVQRGRSLIFVLFLIPMMLPHSMVGLMWKLLYHTEYGLFNWLLSKVGIGPVGWLSDPRYALLSVIIIEIWVNTPFVLMTLFAGLQSLSVVPYEAALIDGANRLQCFRYITLPTLSPLIVVVLLFRVMHAIRVFDAVYSLFRSGGPGNSAQLIGVYLYQTYKVTWKIGLSSAISILLLVMTLVITLGFSIKMYRNMEA